MLRCCTLSAKLRYVFVTSSQYAESSEARGSLSLLTRECCLPMAILVFPLSR